MGSDPIAKGWDNWCQAYVLNVDKARVYLRAEKHFIHLALEQEVHHSRHGECHEKCCKELLKRERLIACSAQTTERGENKVLDRCRHRTFGTTLCPGLHPLEGDQQDRQEARNSDLHIKAQRAQVSRGQSLEDGHHLQDCAWHCGYRSLFVFLICRLLCAASEVSESQVVNHQKGAHPHQHLASSSCYFGAGGARQGVEPIVLKPLKPVTIQRRCSLGA